MEAILLTIREIARKADVSPATVSRYLNGAGNISQEKALKISQVIEQVDSEDMPRIRGANRIVGVIITDMRLQFFCDAQREIIEQIRRYNFQTVFISATGNDKFNYLDTIRSLNLSGLILLDEEISPELMQVIEQCDLKVVICGGVNYEHGHRVTCVHINDISAGYEGTKYLINKGHKSIAFLSDFPHLISCGFQRLAGAKKALEEAGLPFNERLWRCGEITDDMGYKLIKEILLEGIPFTAVSAFSDQMAFGVINALYDEGISVPRDVSVFGFDDLSIAERMRPRLTTVHQPLKKIVSSTLDIFAEKVISEDNTEINIPFSIVERESCRDISGIAI